MTRSISPGKKGKKEQQNIELVRNGLHVKILNVLLYIYLFLILVGTPLYVHDAFFDIGSSKWDWYGRVTFGYVRYPFIVIVPGAQILALILYLWYMADAAIKGVFTKIFDIKKLCITDWCVIIWMAWSVLSFAFAPDKSIALWGFPGWFMGMMAQLSFGWLYFLISRFVRGGKKTVMYVFCCITAALIVAGMVGVIHRHGIDLFGMYEKTWGDEVQHNVTFSDGSVAETAKAIRYKYYLSTIGQSSWFGMWLCPVVPIAVGLFNYGTNAVLRIVGLVGTVVGAMAIAVSSSANAVAGMIAFLLVFCWDAFRDRTQLTRYAGLLFVMCGSWQILHLLLLIFPDSLFLYNEKMNYFLFMGKPMPWITMLLGIIFVLLAIWSRTKTETTESTHVLFIARSIVFGVIGIAVLGLGIYIALNTAGILPESLRSDSKYLVMDIHWGQFRMEMWVVSIRCFLEKISRDPARFIFGMGPDSMYLIFMDLPDKLQQMWLPLATKLGITEENATYLSNAHNEWLTMIINLGIVGGLAYAGMMVTSGVNYLRRFKENPLFVPCAASLLGYIGGAMFSHQEAQAASAVYVIIAIGMAMVRITSQGSEGNR